MLVSAGRRRQGKEEKKGERAEEELSKSRPRKVCVREEGKEGWREKGRKGGMGLKHAKKKEKENNKNKK